MPPVADWDTWKDAIDSLVAEEAGGITSVRTLAVRLRRLDSRQTTENWRSTLNKYRRGPTLPNEETACLLAEVFKVPRNRLPASAEPWSPAQLRVRLERLEVRSEYLERWVALGFEALGVEPELEARARRAVGEPDTP